MNRLTDTSLIVHWFSRDLGLVKTVARGALRPKSPFRGRLDLFFSGEINLVRAKRGDLHTLKEVSVTAWRQDLRRNYLTTLVAGYFCQLVESGLEPEQIEEETYDLLDRALNYLEGKDPEMKTVRFFEREYAKSLGIYSVKNDAFTALSNHLGRAFSNRKEITDRLEN